MHKDANTGDQQKPVIITTLNETKFGVDIPDNMCVQYDTARDSRTVFFHLLNVGGVNALDVYPTNHNHHNVDRSDYLTEVAIALMKLDIERRVNLDTIPREIRARGKRILNQNEVGLEQQQQQSGGNSSKGRCFICPRARDRFTRKKCQMCKKWMCPDHQKTVCEQCFY